MNERSIKLRLGKRHIEKVLADMLSEKDSKKNFRYQRIDGATNEQMMEAFRIDGLEEQSKTFGSGRVKKYRLIVYSVKPRHGSQWKKYYSGIKFYTADSDIRPNEVEYSGYKGTDEHLLDCAIQDNILYNTLCFHGYLKDTMSVPIYI